MTRAEFLQMANKCYDEDDWIEFEGQYTLGSFRQEEGRNRRENPSTSPAEADALEWLDGALATLKQHADSKAAGARVTLRKTGSPNLPPLPSSPEVKREIASVLSRLAGPTHPDPARSTEATGTDGGEIERDLARNLIDLIPAAADRAAKLEPVKSIQDDVPDSVAKLFEEATKCHLYGLDLACVSLCRALLEEGLKRRLDPSGRRSDWPGLEDLLQEAKGRVLKNEYARYAEKVRKAGNGALHKAAASSDATTEVLFMARAILLSMYGKAAAR